MPNLYIPYSRFIFIFYERDFTSDLHKSKRYDPIDLSRCLDDIFPSITLNLRNLFQIYIQKNFSWAKQILQTKTLLSLTSYLHWRSYQRLRKTRWSYFSWLSVNVPRRPSYGIYMLQLVIFPRCCTSVFGFHSNYLQITSKLLTQGYRCHNLRKTFGKFFMSYSEFCPNLVKYRFKNMFLKEYLTRSSMVI